MVDNMVAHYSIPFPFFKKGFIPILSYLMIFNKFIEVYSHHFLEHFQDPSYLFEVNSWFHLAFGSH